MTTTTFRLFLLLCVFLLTTPIGRAQKAAVEIPRPPAGHPRLFVRPATLPALKARLTHPKMTGIVAKVRAQATAVASGISVNGKMSRPTYRAIEASALLYLLEADRAAGQRAVRLLAEALPTLNPENKKHFDDRGLHRVLEAAARVYDWCYDLLTPANRELILSSARRYLGSSEYGWPMREGRITYLTNHFGEEKIPVVLALGIAAYDETTEFYDEAADHLYNGLVPARNAFYPSLRHHQGAAYGPGRYEWEVLSGFLISRMGAKNPYVKEQGLIPYHTLYSRRPDGVISPEGDDFNFEFVSRADGSGYIALAGVMLAAQEYRDPYLQAEAERYLPFVDIFKPIDDAVRQFLYYDPTLDARPADELPLTRFFPSPLSSLTARTGWDLDGGAGSPVAMVNLTMSDYYLGNHDHLDAGHFSIYYKGPLAIDSGAYAESKEGSGKHGGNSGHWANYFRRSIAHNTLLVRDPEEPRHAGSIWDAQNEGGQAINTGGPIEQFNGGAPLTWEEVEADGVQVELLAHDFGPDPQTPEYSHLKGDMAGAYRFGDRRPKVTEAKRSFVFLNLMSEEVPAALMIYDRVTAADSTFKKRWLLHSMEEPVIEDGRVTVRRTGGRLAYDGQLVSQTLLPRADNLTVEAIGGPEQDFLVASAGINYGLKKESDVEKFEAGQWRVEVSPKSAAATDHFFHVLQVMDGGRQPLPLTELRTAAMTGVLLADRAVFFATDGQRVAEEQTIVIPQDVGGRVKVLLTDLAAGTWRLTGLNGSKRFTVTETAGTLYAGLTRGTYRLRR